MKKKDCSITTFQVRTSLQRGLGVKVYHKPTSKTYIFYGHVPRLLTGEVPSHYSPTLFTISEADKFIINLGDKL